MWRCQYREGEAAAKVLRALTRDDLEQIRRVGRLRHPNVLPLLGVTMTKNQFVMVSEWMENGNINQFVKAHADADRLKLVCLMPCAAISTRH